MSLLGEDRTFKSELEIEQLPVSTWKKTPYNVLSKDQNRKLVRYLHTRVEQHCEFCNKYKIQLKVEGRWHYNVDTGIRTLKRLMSICSDCAYAIHYGRACDEGYGNNAKRHLMKVRNFTEEEYFTHLNESGQTYNLLNSVKNWVSDFSLLSNNGYSVKNQTSNVETVSQTIHPESNGKLLSNEEQHERRYSSLWKNRTAYVNQITSYDEDYHGRYYDEDGDPFDPDNGANWDGGQQIGFRD